MSKAIRVYDQAGFRYCFNFETGISVIKTLSRFFNFKAVGCEEGAMVVHL